MALCALLALAWEQLALVGDFRIDDAYITFSFSKNLAAGHGPVFSHGVRVEGYSNFLWMVLVALGYLISPHADPYWWARALALLFLVGAFGAVYRLVRAFASAPAALLALGVFAASTDVWRAAMSGLETVPFSACIVLGWASYLLPPRLSEARPAQAAPRPLRARSLGWFVAAALMRIDGFVPLLIVIGFEAASVLASAPARVQPGGRFRSGLGRLLAFARWAAPAIAIWALYFAWRYWYYGLPLPTTYYAKTVVTANEPDRGYHQLWGFYRDYGLLGLLPLLVIPLFRGPRRAAWALALAVCLQLAYAAQTGGDWMPFERFFLPVWPLLAVLVGWGAARFWRELRELRALMRALAGAALLAALGFSVVRMHAGTTDTPEEAEKLGNARHTTQHTRDNLLANADLMRWVPRQPGERLVTDYAGVFSVYTDAAIIDMWGLCTADIALNGTTAGVNPIYGKSCAECYRRLDPEYFHVMIPIVRASDSFSNQLQVIQNVFLGPEIDRQIDLRHKFVTGRLEQRSSGRTLWFLEKRRPGLKYKPRSPAPGLQIDYPFQ